jgi:RecA-family ATPase
MDYAILPSLPLDQYLQLPRPAQTWVVEPIIPAGGLVNLYSGPKLGKSYIALDLCRAISQGDSNWCGFAIQSQAKVLYIQLDTPRSLWIDRFEKLQEAGIDFTTNEVTPEMPSPMHFFRMADMEQVPYPFNVEDSITIKSLHSQLHDYQPALVVIDTIGEAHKRKENDNDDMKLALAALVAACRPVGVDVTQRAAVLILSHSRKEGEEDRGTTQESRGASAGPGRYDVILRLQAREGATTAKLTQWGRSTPNATHALVKDPQTFLWKKKDNNRATFQAALAEVMKQSFKRQTDQARALQALCPEKSLPACLMAIRRWP